eukprot:GHVP01038448.1.p1 GENE.GHVP01038448.1~~GHVP01038448.1.p1  ORF type:complete len:750 (+),score=101.86 GHVP01038448.1:3884-6133(+)
MPVLKEIARSFSTTFIEISAVILEIIEIGVAFVTWTKDVILEMFDKNQNSPNYYPESPVGKTYFNAGDSTSSTIGTTKDHMFSPTVCPVQLNLPIPPSAGMSPITLTPPSEGPPSPNFCHMNSSVSSAVFGDRSRTAAMQSTSFKSDVGNWKIGLAKATSRVFDDRNRPGFDAFQSTLHQINGGEVYSDRHYCVTKDGYLLVLQHLQRYDSRKQPSFNKMITIRGGASTPLSKNKNKKKSTIVFFHALYESCVNWIITGKNCLPLQCLKSGHDVWVANNRGNLFSCKIPDDVLKGANDALPPDLRYDLEVNNNPRGLRVQFQERNSEEEPKTPASLGSIGENLLSPTNSSITNSSPTNFNSLRSPDPNGNEIYRQLVQMCDCPPCRIEGFDTVLRHILPSKLYPFKCNNRRLEDNTASWTMDEMGRYDVPAVLDYVTKFSGVDKCTVMGVSQGGSQLLMYLSLFRKPKKSSQVSHDDTSRTTKNDATSRTTPASYSNTASPIIPVRTTESTPLLAHKDEINFLTKSPIKESHLFQDKEDNEEFPSEFLFPYQEKCKAKRCFLFGPAAFVHPSIKSAFSPRFVKLVGAVALDIMFRIVAVRRQVLPEFVVAKMEHYMSCNWLKIISQDIPYETKTRAYKYTPSGHTSANNLAQFYQMAKEAKPIFKFKSVETTGPRYPIENINIPLFVFLGKEDFLVHSEAVQQELENRITDSELLKIEMYDNMRHMDFHWKFCKGMNEKVLATMKPFLQ